MRGDTTMKNVEIKGLVFQIKAEEKGQQIWFHFQGRIFVMDKKPARSLPTEEEKKQKIHQKTLLSPMPGQIVKVFAEPGMKVRENQTLVVLSSMKMEYTVKAFGEALVKTVKVQEGDQVSAQEELVLFH